MVKLWKGGSYAGAAALAESSQRENGKETGGSE